MPTPSPQPLIDGHGRQISYVRLSVTDRCDFRCSYCMAEDMTFLPRQQVLSLEEIARVARVFVGLGVGKLRVTGGEPLVRRDVAQLFTALGKLSGLRELAVTTNGSQLSTYAPVLRQAGVTSLNISLDTLDAHRFKAMTRVGNLTDVLAGVDAAVAEGFPRIRLNAVILRHSNDQDIRSLVRFAVARGVDIAFIEEMPLGHVNLAGKPLSFMSSNAVYDEVAGEFELTPEAAPEHAGPAQYWRIAGTASRMGLISPHSNNFCASCNRLRVTAEGRLLLCLGNEHSISLRDLLREGASDEELTEAIRTALSEKPERHVFDQPDQPQIMRFMNASGG